MRLTALAGFFACTIICAASSSPVNAEASDILEMNIPEEKQSTASVLETIKDPKNSDDENQKSQPAKVEPKVHQIGPNESLSAVAERHQTSWTRIYNKNEHITQPDLVKVGEKVVIPQPDEVLKERPLPEPPAPQAVESQVAAAPGRNNPDTKRQNAAPGASVSRGAVAGNTYAPGYCTWYAKNMRPDLPNNLGNANTWAARAAAQGIPTGTVPRAGAIGQQGMHVVYVQRVNGNGTVTISEMNYKGLYVTSTRTVPASSFIYIY